MREVEYKDFRRAAIERAVAALRGTTIKVGVQGTSGFVRKDVRVSTGGRRRVKGKRSGKTLKAASRLRTVDIATIHEFGSPKAGIPERSFLRSAIRDNKAKLQDHMRRAWKVALRAESAADSGSESKLARQVKRVAVFAESAVKKQIVELRDPPLAESTKRRRKRLTGDSNPNPLIDTGELKNSITVVVEGGLG